MPWYSFFECWVLSQLFHSPLLPSRDSLVTDWESCKSLSVYLPSYLFVYPSCPSIYHISMKALVPSFIMRDYNPNRIALENFIKPLYKYKTLLFLPIPIILRHMLRFQTIIYHFSLFPKEFAIRKSFFFFCTAHTVMNIIEPTKVWFSSLSCIF